mgnify:CR=1 FL=1
MRETENNKRYKAAMQGVGMQNVKMQQEAADKGSLQVNVTSSVNSYPISEARISISYTGVPENTLEQLVTDSSGQTDMIELDAPPEEWSLDPENERQPYSEYTLNVSAPGFEPVSIAGTEILANTKAIQNIRMRPTDTGREEEEIFVIPAHTLYAEYPPKIAEDEIKPVNESGEIVLSRVVIPEYVIVHDGAPSDPTARDYYVRYRDYIKNVASSEIYSTWPDATIRANVLAIMSFTLNRVYTEWYRNKGYDFTITTSTAYDHKWVYGRNIFDSISRIVDEIFASYVSRPNVKQPILTQYCDGKRVSCPNAMSQWGSKALGDDGYSDIEILRYYYGSSAYINTAEEISGIPASYPGYELTIGSSGEKVRQLQEQLNTIANTYTSIPKVAVDGIYGEATQEAVRQFQKIFNLPQTGVVDYPTWYRISAIYVALTKIAELQ